MILDLGCGKSKKNGAIGIDFIKMPGVDVVCDLNKGLPLPDNSVDGIYASHILEHLDDFMFAMKEIWRVLKKNGWVKIWVPHFSAGFITWGDPTHKRGFSIGTFECFLPERNITYIKNHFLVDELRLNFALGGKIVKGKKIKHKIYLFFGMIIEKIVNRNRMAQKSFESHWSQFFPFCEIYVKLKVLK